MSDHDLTYKWTKRFYRMAMLIATWSKDPKCAVGTVIATHDCRNISTGYNGFPRGFEDKPERLADKDQRLAFTVHAELNAIYNARFSLHQCLLFSTKFPCHECAKGIIQAGIICVVCPPPTQYAQGCGTWAISQKNANLMLTEASVKVVILREEEMILG